MYITHIPPRLVYIYQPRCIWIPYKSPPHWMHYALNANMYTCAKTWTSALMKACLWSTNDEKAIGGPPSPSPTSCVKNASKVQYRRAEKFWIVLFISLLYLSYSSSSSPCQTSLLHDSSINTTTVQSRGRRKTVFHGLSDNCQLWMTCWQCQHLPHLLHLCLNDESNNTFDQ